MGSEELVTLFLRASLLAIRPAITPKALLSASQALLKRKKLLQWGLVARPPSDPLIYPKYPL